MCRLRAKWGRMNGAAGRSDADASRQGLAIEGATRWQGFTSVRPHPGDIVS